MTTRVLIIGGYGNFGSFISRRLAKDRAIKLIIGGRSLAKARILAGELGAEAVALDVDQDIAGALSSIRPEVVIHTSGPFQGQTTLVAEACIAHGCHYIDLADGRAFVDNIASLNQRAKGKDVLVISGASSVPALTSALLDHMSPSFRRMDDLYYAISTSLKFRPGPATIAAIFSYVGKRIRTIFDGEWTNVYGQQSLHRCYFPGLGRRLLANCEIPDLSLFPDRYPDLKTIRFYAGVDVALVQITLWLLSWLVRIGLIRKLERLAAPLLSTSQLFNWMGSDLSGLYLRIRGIGHDGSAKTTEFHLVARSGHGPNIPCVPAILLAQKLARGEIEQRGAMACMGFIALEEFLEDLKTFDIEWSFSKR